MRSAERETTSTRFLCASLAPRFESATVKEGGDTRGYPSEEHRSAITRLVFVPTITYR